MWLLEWCYHRFLVGPIFMDSANVSLEDRKGDVGVIWVLDVLSRKG